MCLFLKVSFPGRIRKKTKLIKHPNGFHIAALLKGDFQEARPCCPHQSPGETQGALLSDRETGLDIFSILIKLLLLFGHTWWCQGRFLSASCSGVAPGGALVIPWCWGSRMQSLRFDLDNFFPLKLPKRLLCTAKMKTIGFQIGTS